MNSFLLKDAFGAGYVTSIGYGPHEEAKMSREEQVTVSTRESNERRLIEDALKSSRGNTQRASKTLAISEKALLRKMKEYNIGVEKQ